MSRALRAVAKQQYAFGQNFADPFQGRRRARYVGGGGYDNKFRIRLKQRFYALFVDVSVF